MANAQPCFIEIFVDSTKGNQTRFKKVNRVPRPNGALWRVTWDGREYVCRYEDNLTVDPETGEQVGIFSQNGEEVVLVYRIPQSDKDFYAPEKIAQRAREADEALEYLKQSKQNRENGKAIAETCQPGDLVTFIDTQFNCDTFKREELETRQARYLGPDQYGLGIQVEHNGASWVVYFDYILGVSHQTPDPQVNRVENGFRLWYAQNYKTAFTGKIFLPGQADYDEYYTVTTYCRTSETRKRECILYKPETYTEKNHIVQEMKFDQCAYLIVVINPDLWWEVFYRSDTEWLALNHAYLEDLVPALSLNTETPDQQVTQVDQTPDPEKTGYNDLAETCQPGDVVTFFDPQYSWDPVTISDEGEMTGIYQGVNESGLGINVLFNGKIRVVFRGNISGVFHQQTPQYDRVGHQVDQTPDPDLSTTQEQADALVESLDMTCFVEEYEYNHLGHVYTLQDGSSLVVTSPTSYTWEV